MDLWNKQNWMKKGLAETAVDTAHFRHMHGMCEES